MPANRTAATLLLQLTEMRIERDRLKRENELLCEQLRKHPAGELQIREAHRRLAAFDRAQEQDPTLSDPIDDRNSWPSNAGHPTSPRF